MINNHLKYGCITRFKHNGVSVVRLFAHKGYAARVDADIWSQINPYPYMNGYCWSSLIKYYIRETAPSLHISRFSPCEDYCDFIFDSDSDSSAFADFLCSALESEETLVHWIIENDFDEWDDW